MTQKPAPLESINVDIINNARETIGIARFLQQAGGGVKVSVTASNIPEGAHGIHLHQKADCSADDFKSAGGHINARGVAHGLKNPNGPDNADMPNAQADKGGYVNYSYINYRISLNGAENIPALLDSDGSALIMHINPDDQITQPIGGAGARIACAEIK